MSMLGEQPPYDPAKLQALALKGPAVETSPRLTLHAFRQATSLFVPNLCPARRRVSSSFETVEQEVCGQAGATATMAPSQPQRQWGPDAGPGTRGEVRVRAVTGLVVAEPGGSNSSIAIHAHHLESLPRTPTRL